MDDASEDFRAYAEAFAGGIRQGSDIAAAHLLQRASLDYSVDSLKSVDEYLAKLHDADESGFTDEEYGNAVLWAAAYFGEVIRRNARSRYAWTTHEVFRQQQPAVAVNVPAKETTKWVLWEMGGSVLTPIEKVLRRVSQGGDRLWPFAVALLNQGV